MTRNRFLAIAGIGLAATLAFSGCAPAEDDGTVTLQMVESLTDPARTALLETLIGEFEEKNPDIDVELVSPPTEQADQKLQQMLQAGEGVDVLEVRDITVGPFAANGWLADMTPEFEGWSGWDALTDDAKKVATAGGKTSFIPYGFYGMSIFYRSDLVEDAGFDGPPKSWDDLLEQAEAIQDPGANTFGYAFRGGRNGFSNADLIIEAYVADDLDPENAYRLKNGDSIFSAPEALDALELYFELFEKASPPSSVAWGFPEMVEGFSNGSTAFLLQSQEIIPALQKSTAITEDQWSTTPMLLGPTGKSVQPALATAGWGIAEASDHKAEAAKLIQFLSERDVSIRFTEGSSLVPIIADAQDSEFYASDVWESYRYMSDHPETYVNTSPPRNVAWWTEWSAKADTDLQQVLVGQLTPEELLAGWDAYWVEKWASE